MRLRVVPDRIRPVLATLVIVAVLVAPASTAWRAHGSLLLGPELRWMATLEMPVAIAFRPGDAAPYVAEKAGRVFRVDPRTGVDPEPVLNLEGEVSLDYEQGLVGLAFSPSGEHLYVSFTDPEGDSRIVEYAVSGGRADLATRRDVLFADQPTAIHNNGHVTFGPDGNLYIGLGDGGDFGDPLDSGQDRSTVLGSVLRVDTRSGSTAAYGIPPDNPFVGETGVRPEVWVYGLRQPWRFSFDRLTGDLWLGDVGEYAVEEVNFRSASEAAGSNFGWSRFEGNRPFREPAPARHVPPLFEYLHEDGNCAVTGGYVYRGKRLPRLYGSYLFGDYCSGEIFMLRHVDGEIVEHGRLGPRAPLLTSFGEDARGEIYVLSLYGGVYRLDRN